MSMEEIISHCKYFKGEASCPFEDETKEAIFWFAESTYARKAAQSDEFRSGRIKVAERYIETHVDLDALMGSDDIHIETKAIALYIEVLLAKWRPDDVDIVFDY